MFYEKTVLDNGITVMTEHMEGVRSVALGLWFCVGSRDETPAQAGMSHFMEHMMFKGTPTRDFLDISTQFEELGAEINAFTSKEYTCYYARFVDDKLAKVMDLFGDMVTNSLFSQESINSEREVVIEEIARGEDTPDDHIFDLFSESMLPDHPLGRPIVGTRDIVGGFEHADCQSYHDTHYKTGNLVVAACGNIDHAVLVALAEQYLSGVPQGVRTQRDHDINSSNESFNFLKKETEQAHIIYGMPALPANHPDRYIASVIELALGGGMSSRLFQEVREKRGLAYAVYAMTMPYIGHGQFAVYAGTRPANIEEVVGIVKDEMAKIASEGIREDELSRVRDYAMGHILLDMEMTTKRMVRIGRGSVLNLDLLSYDEISAMYNAVTLDDVGRVAREIFTHEPTLAIISPRETDELHKLFG